MPGLSRPPPMALTFSLTNIMKFLSYMAPFLISFFMIMFSILTGSIVKGLLFISGLLIVTFMNYLLKNSLKSLQDPLASPLCNSLPAPFTLRAGEHIFNSPSTSSTIIAFTLAYLAYPMILKPINMNPVLIAFLVALIGINGAVEVQDRCTNVSGIFLGSLVGILFGIIFFSLVKMSGNESLAFFTEQGSNGIQCSKPSKTNFKCVKKHGSSLRDISEETSSNGQSSVTGILTPFDQKAKDNFMYISSDIYTKGTSLAEESKIPVGFKCPSSKDNGLGTICDLGGYCSNNNCVACRSVNDCYKNGYGGAVGGPWFNIWNRFALKCGVSERPDRNWRAKIYDCKISSDDELLKTSSINYPDNHEVKQCVLNRVATDTYLTNRKDTPANEPSVDGIIFIQKNIAKNVNELKLTQDEAQELVDYFTIIKGRGRELHEKLLYDIGIATAILPTAKKDPNGDFLSDGDDGVGGKKYFQDNSEIKALAKQKIIKNRLQKYSRDKHGLHVPHSSFYQESNIKKDDGFINMLWRDKKNDVVKYITDLSDTFTAYNNITFSKADLANANTELGEMTDAQLAALVR